MCVHRDLTLDSCRQELACEFLNAKDETVLALSQRSYQEIKSIKGDEKGSRNLYIL